MAIQFTSGLLFRVPRSPFVAVSASATNRQLEFVDAVASGRNWRVEITDTYAAAAAAIEHAGRVERILRTGGVT